MESASDYTEKKWISNLTWKTYDEHITRNTTLSSLPTEPKLLVLVNCHIRPLFAEEKEFVVVQEKSKVGTEVTRVESYADIARP